MTIALDDALARVVDGTILPHGHYICPACGAVIDQFMGSRTGREQPQGVSFTINGCSVCGHVVRSLGVGAVRDLTRAEAQELAACPDFARVRSVVDNAVANLRG